MAELLKNVYNKEFITILSGIITEVLPEFEASYFAKKVFDSDWKNKELKQRMSHIAYAMKFQMPEEYEKRISVVLELVEQIKMKGFDSTLEWMFLPEFIDDLDENNYKVSINALEKVTQFTTCEFAVRPFILKYPEQLIVQMMEWASHENANVRRLATEGCRPRLPWSMALPFLKNDPNPIMPILEKLKNDSSLTVRRSVANNLNDIAKDNPETVIKTAKKWIGKTEETDWVVKHASRTLLKQGNLEVMKLFGFGDINELEIKAFKVNTPTVKIGEYLSFSFRLKNQTKTRTKLRLEYGLYYQKANGNLARKVFKISEKMYKPNSETEINKRQSFKIISTRKFHVGLHQVSIIINGVELDRLDFELKKEE